MKSHNRCWSRILGNVSMTATVCLVVMGCPSAKSERSPAVERSVSAPPAMAFDLDGQAIDPVDEFSGQIVVLAFWRIDCPVARRYHPELRRLKEEFGERGVEFVLVFPNARRTATDIREHMQEFEQSCAAIHDPNHVLVAKTGARITPEAVVYDRSGRLFYQGRIDNRSPEFGIVRPATTHELGDAIEAVLTGGEAPVPDGPPIGCYISDLKNRSIVTAPNGA